MDNNQIDWKRKLTSRKFWMRSSKYALNTTRSARTTS